MSHYSTPDSWNRRQNKRRAKAERLALSKLPETQDGMPVVPHVDVVFFWDQGTQRVVRALAVFDAIETDECWTVKVGSPEWIRCYSTHEEADKNKP